MRNQEEKGGERTVHTKQFKVRLKSGAERNKFFKKIDDEWTGVYRRFISENPIFYEISVRMFSIRKSI